MKTTQQEIEETKQAARKFPLPTLREKLDDMKIELQAMQMIIKITEEVIAEKEFKEQPEISKDQVSLST